MNPDDSGMPKRQRVLFVTRNLPPLVGGMERLLLEALKALSVQWAVDVIGPEGCSASLPAGCHVLAELPFSASRFLPASLAAVLRHADRDVHALCLVGSGLMAPALWAARQRGVRTAVFAHGLDVIYPHPVYRVLFLPQMRRAEWLISNSRHTAGLMAARGIEPRRITVINPGVDPAPRTGLSGEAWRAQNLVGTGPMLLSVGRLVPRKGVAEFVTEVLPHLLQKHPQLRLVVAGAEPPGGRAVSQSICAAAQAAGVGHAVQLLGRVEDEVLQALYDAADVHVFPVRATVGDVEGFGMVALEAAARGLPTAAYAVDGVPDAIGTEGGSLVPPGDAAAMAAAIETLLREGRQAWSSRLIQWAQHNSWQHYGSKLRQVLESSLQAGSASPGRVSP